MVMIVMMMMALALCLDDCLLSFADERREGLWVFIGVMWFESITTLTF